MITLSQIKTLLVRENFIFLYYCCCFASELQCTSLASQAYFYSVGGGDKSNKSACAIVPRRVINWEFYAIIDIINT